MKITIEGTEELDNAVVSVSVNTNEEMIGDVVNCIGGALVAYGYSYNNVCEFLNTELYNSDLID